MKQPSLFDIPEIHIDKPIRLIELFGGIGAQAMALRDIGADFERWRYVDFDKHCVASYNAIHGTEFKPSYITQVRGADLAIDDIDKYVYLLTYSFPCQDLSLAGKQLGMAKGSNTRSCLLWEVERLLNEAKNLPQILLMENVPQVHGKKNAPDFQHWISFLNGKGYNSFWQDLNAADYGLPQNRDRCFMLSLLGDFDFEFPDAIKLERTMLSCLEPSVPEKFYINTPKAKELVQNYLAQKKDYKVAECVGGIGEKKSNGGTQFYQQDRVYAGDIALAHPAGLSEGSYKYILPEVVQAGNINPSGRGINGGVISAEGLARAVTTEKGEGQKVAVPESAGAYRIRKLTPRECWRLMGFSDQDFDKAAACNSNTQLYRQAGNSICVNVLSAIFRQLNIKGVPRWNKL